MQSARAPDPCFFSSFWSGRKQPESDGGLNQSYPRCISESEVGCRVCRVAGGGGSFIFREGSSDFHFEQSLCEPYRPYRDIGRDEWELRELRLGCKMLISGVDFGIRHLL
jgi:hypothetical protein